MNFKNHLKKIISPALHRQICELRYYKKIAKCRKLLARENANNPKMLAGHELAKLQSKYPHPPPYAYDAAVLLDRGKERAWEIIKKAPQADNFLEIGAHDGMVSYCLALAGKKCTAIDIDGGQFDGRAKEKVELMEMDAKNLDFPDNFFDCVFSYDSFEHFDNPSQVLKEIVRVLKPGGIAYFYFGPLYNSPKGLHAYNIITVPYCQFLFSMEVLNKFAHDYHLGTINYAQVNKLAARDFDKLWSGSLQSFRIIEKTLEYDYSALDLIISYPQLFRLVNSDLNEFLIKTISLLIKKQ